MEWDDFGNDKVWPYFKYALLEEGLVPGVWFTNGGNIRLTPADAGFAIAEDEGVSDRQGIIDAIPYLDPAMPKAVVSNMWVIKKNDGSGETDIAASLASTRPLVEAGFSGISEVYIRNDSGAPTGVTPDSLAYIARNHLGYKRVQPVFGIFGGAKVPDYERWRISGAWSDYVVENTLR